MNFRRNVNYKLVRQLSLNVSGYQRKNHYDCLGITPKATQGDVKSAYYRLSKQYHPDLNKGNRDAAEKFRDITEAYEVLGNLKSRKLYDRGLLIGGTEHSYTQNEPVVDNYEHSSFYHHRNKPTSKRATSESTPHYNIDEWTRAHYSHTFRQAYEKKSEGIKNAQNSYKELEENKGIWQVGFSVALFLTAFLLYSAKSSGYDVAHNLKPDEKPD
uniref:J domain-containing protein n=1 Tax=Cuerna arida TaxID=1464854 RepID=A0A1B6FYQ9_9HEMI